MMLEELEVVSKNEMDKLLDGDYQISGNLTQSELQTA